MELLKKPFGTFISILTIYAAFMQLHFPESWHLADRSDLPFTKEHRLLWFFHSPGLF
jgi:hypothetical protein